MTQLSFVGDPATYSARTGCRLRLIIAIEQGEPDPAAANALQEGLGQFGEMRTMRQYLFQMMKPYRDLIQRVGAGISHVELIGTTIPRLLDDSSRYQGKPTDPLDTPCVGGTIPLTSPLTRATSAAISRASRGRCLSTSSAPPGGSYVYSSDNVVFDLIYNLMLESTGAAEVPRLRDDRQQGNPIDPRLIVRDQAHENTYTTALESFAVEWNKLPVRRRKPSSLLRSRAPRSWSAVPASHLRPRRTVGGRQDLPGALAVEGRHGSRCLEAGSRGSAVGHRRREIRGVRSGPVADATPVKKAAVKKKQES